MKEKNIVYCDVLIMGAGPAGLTAAIYASRSKLSTLIIDSGFVGGQVATTFHIENYPGTRGVINGIDLMDNMKDQALRFGAKIYDLQPIIDVDFAGETKLVKTVENDFYAKAVIIATGAEPRKLPVEGEQYLRGRGIHYCATCDGAMYQDANLLVVGGGTSAIEEAVFLTRYAKSVTIIKRSSQFNAAKSIVANALKNPAVSVLWNTIVKEIKGDNFLKSVVIEHMLTGERKEIQADGVFVYIGMQPNSLLFTNKLKLSDTGYIITDERMMTSVPGVFAAGDVREKEIRQISTAVGDGTVAGIMAERYIAGG